MARKKKELGTFTANDQRCWNYLAQDKEQEQQEEQDEQEEQDYEDENVY